MKTINFYRALVVALVSTCVFQAGYISGLNRVDSEVVMETEYSDPGLNAGYLEYINDLDLSTVELPEAEAIEEDIPIVTEMWCDQEEEEEPELLFVSSTAYYDAYGYGYGAMGKNYPLQAGWTVAGKVEWLGKIVEIYDEDMNYIGRYQFLDTGYGAPTGYGESSILSGKTVGTIEAGQCIDIYFDTYEECCQWGRRNLYIQIIDEEG